MEENINQIQVNHNEENDISNRIQKGYGKLVFNEKEIQQLQKQMKQNQKYQSRNNLFVTNNQNQIHSDLFDGFSQSQKYGDNCTYFAQRIINPISLNINYDSFYNGQAEFILSERFTLQMLGIATNKNNLAIMLFFPKINYNFSSKTNFQGGVVLGSTKRFSAGFSHAYSPKTNFSFNSQFCSQLKKLQTQFQVNEKISDLINFNANLTLNNNLNKNNVKNFHIPKNYEVRLQFQKYYGINEQKGSLNSYFGNILHKRQVGLSLGSFKQKILASQSSKFDCLSLKTKFSASICFTNKGYSFESKSFLKWYLTQTQNTCLYFGIKQAYEGHSFMIGMKIGGIKMIFPVLILNSFTENLSEPVNQDHAKLLKEFEYSNFDILTIVAAYLVSQTCFGILNYRKKKSLILDFKKEQLLKIKQKHYQEVEMIKDIAKSHQKSFLKKGLKIYRAYYGTKSEIEKYIDLVLKSMQEDQIYWEDNQSLQGEKEISELFVINVTTPVRFYLSSKMNQNQGGLFLCKNKQFALGFENPVPDFLIEKPALCVIYKKLEENQENKEGLQKNINQINQYYERSQMKFEFYNDNQDLIILCPNFVSINE